jgi:hypothetical protein
MDVLFVVAVHQMIRKKGFAAARTPENEFVPIRDLAHTQGFLRQINLEGMSMDPVA